MDNQYITPIVITSPIPSHPSTRIIEETLDSIRYHLPEATILILADGVRNEEMDRRSDYFRYLAALTETTITKYGDVRIRASFDHLHQVGLMRDAFAHKLIDTPFLLFMEHDTPLLQRSIPWLAIIRVLQDTPIDYIRFNPEEQIPKEHMHLMIGEPIESFGVRMQRTMQFHARPHVATIEFYQKLLGKFSIDANCFIEDLAHSFCQYEGWNAWPMAIYTPEGGQKRSTHTNAREGSKKFDNEQIF